MQYAGSFNGMLIFTAWNDGPDSGTFVLHPTSTELYFSDQGQVLEQRNSQGFTQSQYVWSPVYVNAMVLRDRDSNGNGTLNEREYVVQDANWNVEMIVNDYATVVEKYTYTLNGSPVVLSSMFGIYGASPTSVSWQYYLQGERYDRLTGTYLMGARNYDPGEMTWREADPTGYPDGMNRYEMERGNPTNRTDPDGLWTITRDGRDTATATATKDGDSIEDLAVMAKMDPDSASAWMQPFPGDEPILCGDQFEVPNTMYLTMGDVSVNPIQGIFHRNDAYNRLMTEADAYKKSGFKVVINTDLSARYFSRMQSDNTTYGWFHIGHGAAGQINLADGTQLVINKFLKSGLDHRWGLVYLVVCQAAYSVDPGRAPNQLGWRDLVSVNGELHVTSDLTDSTTKVPVWPPGRLPPPGPAPTPIFPFK